MPRHPGSGHGPFGRNILWFFLRLLIIFSPHNLKTDRNVTFCCACLLLRLPWSRHRYH